MRVKRIGSDCSHCPLRDNVRVPTEAPQDGKAQIVIVGEAPGAVEEREQKPFCGPAGAMLNMVLKEAEINRFNCRVMNVLSCRPPDNNIESEEAKDALRCCKVGFQKEIADARRLGARVILALGSTAMGALEIDGSITKNRGSVFSAPGGKPVLPCVPTYHPAFILRGMRKEEPTWIADFKKAKEIARTGWKPPKEDFNIEPTLADVEDFVEEAVRKRSLIAVDLETTGLTPDTAEIFVVGLADTGEHAISVPFFKHGGAPYWEASDEVAVKELLQKLFDVCPTLFQNALFDVVHLRHKNFVLNGEIHDALLLHHAIHPELPHNLGYIVSIYGSTPYWKDGVLRRDGSLASVPDETLRTYNLRDAAVLHQIYPALLEDAKELRTLPVYTDVSAKLVPVLSAAILRGVLVDKKRLAKYKQGLEETLRVEDAELRNVGKLCESFNLGSGDDLRLLFYGLKAEKFKRAQTAFSDYAADKKKRKDTKKYVEICALCQIAEKTEPLWRAPRSKLTDSGRLSVDDEALLSVQIAATGRAEYLRSLKKRTTEHEREAKLVQRTLDFLKHFRTYQETTKLLSTYTSFPVWSDGRVHANFTIHGTATGRLSSSRPNMQNIPKDVRKIFIASPGNTFIQADYSNLELRVLAFISDDKPMLEAFAAGKNIHDENCKALFNITPDHPNWAVARRAAKVYVFGRNYGGGLRGIYERVCKDVPDLPLTFAQFSAADRAYRNAHPAYAKWVARTQAEVLGSHTLRNVFGRIRIFLGTPFEIMREGLNFPIQSAAADIVNRAMIGIYSDFQRTKMKAAILVQVHDSLLVECPLEERSAVISILKKNMEQTFNIEGKKVHFPVDVEEGPSWGEMKKIE